MSPRALHFVFKVGDRKLTTTFYKDVLGMKILRHEEFDEGCKAACNGPYDGKWSKTMVGYGPEENHFVVELTYNYGLSSYALGNDFLGLYIQSSEALSRARQIKWPIETEGQFSVLKAPGGYKFFISDKPQPHNADPVSGVALASSNLNRSVIYWRDLLGMDLIKQTGKEAILRFGESQATLTLTDIGTAVDHAKAFGRIAFACPGGSLPEMQEKAQKANAKILTPFVSLETPGKATVQVVIFADPDGHEICFVGEEGFGELSQVDPKADELLDTAMKADKSDDWFKRHGKEKAAA